MHLLSSTSMLEKRERSVLFVCFIALFNSRQKSLFNLITSLGMTTCQWSLPPFSLTWYLLKILRNCQQSMPPSLSFQNQLMNFSKLSPQLDLICNDLKRSLKSSREMMPLPSLSNISKALLNDLMFERSNASITRWIIYSSAVLDETP